MARLQKELGRERFLDLLKVNRVDLEHAVELDTLVVPESASDPLGLAPFPRFVSLLDSIPKLVLISLPAQAFSAYESGALVRWGPVSSGAADSPTPPGVYAANWKAALRVSSVNERWVLPWCVNIENDIGMNLHEYALPGYPASHCCIRLLEEDARWIYGWIQTWTLTKGARSVWIPGTPVVIIGEYDFLAPPPWRGLVSDPEATRVQDAAIRDALMGLPAIRARSLSEATP